MTTTTAAMTRPEWRAVVDRLNAAFPGQQLPPPAAAEWFRFLDVFPAAEVAAAVERMTREQFTPTLRALLEAIDANDRERRAAAAERTRLERREQAIAARRRGVDMPPETRAAVELLKASLAENADKAAIRAEIEQLAEQLERCLAHPTERPGQSTEGQTAAEATRTCKQCAASPVPGLVGRTLPPGHAANPYPWPLADLVPCRSCRPERYEAWRRGRLAARCDADGQPLNRDRTSDRTRDGGRDGGRDGHGAAGGGR